MAKREKISAEVGRRLFWGPFLFVGEIENRWSLATSYVFQNDRSQGGKFSGDRFTKQSGCWCSHDTDVAVVSTHAIGKFLDENGS